MAIKFIKERSFWWTVTVDVPADDSTEKHEFKVYIKDHSSKEYAEALTTSGEAFVKYLASLISDWEGVQDEQGKPLPCTEENKLEVLDIGYMLSGLLGAMAKIQSGEAEAKN